MSPRAERHRPYFQLPADLVEDIKRFTEVNGTTVAELCYHWIVTAANLAAHDLGHLLPQERRAPRGSLGGQHVVRWMQGPDEFRRCREVIEGAGSSVGAVLRAAGQSYVEAGGDVVTMAWPQKRVDAEAA